MVFESNQDNEIVWDFRQSYVEWVRVYFKDFIDYHRINNYPKMYEILCKVHPFIWGRVIKKQNVNRNDTDFEDIKKRLIIKVHNPLYKKTYELKERNSEAVFELDKSFGDMVGHLITLMKTHGMFGRETINRGL